MRRWVDVDPLDWFYRDVEDATRLFTDGNGADPVVAGMYYNVFEPNHGRVVKRFITVEGQQEFLIPEYKYHPENPMYVLVNGVEVKPEAIEDGKVTMSNPMSAGIEVVCIAFGKPKFTQIGCVNSPMTGCSEPRSPHADLKNKASYVFSFSCPAETCSVLGVKLKRLIVDIFPGDNPDEKITQAINFKRDVFVIHDGRVYLPYQYNGFPAKVGYNYINKGVVKYTTETVIVKSSCVYYNDRFFPNVRLRRSEFFVFLNKIRKNLYNGFTDREYQPNTKTSRYIADKNEWNDKWYTEDLLDILDEKYLDGCYVFPLYADGRFEPEECITRAEAVTYLHRFIEWAVEKFR